MEKDLKSTVVKDEALKQSFAEIKKAAETGKTTVAKASADKPVADKKETTKTVEKKEAAKSAEKKPAEKKETSKAAEKKTAEKKETAKAVEKKTVEKKETAKAAEKKTVEKKETAKTTEKKSAVAKTAVSTYVVLQLHGQDFEPEKIKLDAIAAARNIKPDVKSVDVYINVAESAAYYTIDGQGSSEYRIDL